MIKPTLSLTVTGVSPVHLGPGIPPPEGFFLCNWLLLGTNPASGQSHCAPWRALVDNGPQDRTATLGTQRLVLRRAAAYPEVITLDGRKQGPWRTPQLHKAALCGQPEGQPGGCR